MLFIVAFCDRLYLWPETISTCDLKTKRPWTKLDESGGGQKTHCCENVSGTSRGIYSCLMSDSNVSCESR